MKRQPPVATSNDQLLPYTTLFRADVEQEIWIQRRDADLSVLGRGGHRGHRRVRGHAAQRGRAARAVLGRLVGGRIGGDQGLAERAVDEHGAYSSIDRKSTRLNSSH